jgi:DNA-binding GntR family transcriptional regulator
MKQFTFQQQNNVSLREKVTMDLRNAILSGSIQPGDRLKEFDIANQMGVSRGPVREAIRQLEREGLLISTPYKETVVAEVELEEVRDVLVPIRYQLEWFVIKKYLQLMNEAFFTSLLKIIDSMEQQESTENIEQLVEQDMLFHETIISLAREKTVMLTWKSISNQIRLHFMKNIRYYEKGNIYNDHKQLLEAFRTKNIELIQKELLHHMQGDEAFLYFLQSTTHI